MPLPLPLTITNSLPFPLYNTCSRCPHTLPARQKTSQWWVPLPVPSRTPLPHPLYNRCSRYPAYTARSSRNWPMVIAPPPLYHPLPHLYYRCSICSSTLPACQECLPLSVPIPPSLNSAPSSTPPSYITLFYNTPSFLYKRHSPAPLLLYQFHDQATQVVKELHMPCHRHPPGKKSSRSILEIASSSYGLQSTSMSISLNVFSLMWLEICYMFFQETSINKDVLYPPWNGGI